MNYPSLFWSLDVMFGSHHHYCLTGGATSCDTLEKEQKENEKYSGLNHDCGPFVQDKSSQLVAGVKRLSQETNQGTSKLPFTKSDLFS